MTATPWISSSAFGLARCEMAIEALAGNPCEDLTADRRHAWWLRGSVMNTVMVTMSDSLPPASSSVAPRLAKTCRTWASKSPASDCRRSPSLPSAGEPDGLARALADHRERIAGLLGSLALDEALAQRLRLGARRRHQCRQAAQRGEPAKMSRRDASVSSIVQ